MSHGRPKYTSTSRYDAENYRPPPQPIKTSTMSNVYPPILNRKHFFLSPEEVKAFYQTQSVPKKLSHNRQCNASSKFPNNNHAIGSNEEPLIFLHPPPPHRHRTRRNNSHSKHYRHHIYANDFAGGYENEIGEKVRVIHHHPNHENGSNSRHYHKCNMHSGGGPPECGNFKKHYRSPNFQYAESNQSASLKEKIETEIKQYFFAIKKVINRTFTDIFSTLDDYDKKNQQQEQSTHQNQPETTDSPQEECFVTVSERSKSKNSISKESKKRSRKDLRKISCSSRHSANVKPSGFIYETFPLVSIPLIDATCSNDKKDLYRKHFNRYYRYKNEEIEVGNFLYDSNDYHSDSNKVYLDLVEAHPAGANLKRRKCRIPIYTKKGKFKSTFGIGSEISESEAGQSFVEKYSVSKERKGVENNKTECPRKIKDHNSTGKEATNGNPAVEENSQNVIRNIIRMDTSSFEKRKLYDNVLKNKQRQANESIPKVSPRNRTPLELRFMMVDSKTQIVEKSSDFCGSESYLPDLGLISKERFDELYECCSSALGEGTESVEKSLHTILNENFEFLSKDFSYTQTNDKWHDFVVAPEAVHYEANAKKAAQKVIEGNCGEIIESSSIVASEESGFVTLQSRPVSVPNFFKLPTIQKLCEPPVVPLSVHDSMRNFDIVSKEEVSIKPVEEDNVNNTKKSYASKKSQVGRNSHVLASLKQFLRRIRRRYRKLLRHRKTK